MRRVFKAAALAALLAAAAVAAPERSSQTIESHTFDHKTTEKKRHELRVPGDGARVRLHVKVSVREGAIMVTVRDAAGAVRQDLRLGPAPSAYNLDTGEVRSPAGVWTVEVETKEAVGSYEVTFTQNQG